MRERDAASSLPLVWFQFHHHLCPFPPKPGKLSFSSSSSCLSPLQPPPLAGREAGETLLKLARRARLAAQCGRRRNAGRRRRRRRAGERRRRSSSGPQASQFPRGRRRSASRRGARCPVSSLSRSRYASFLVPRLCRSAVAFCVCAWNVRSCRTVFELRLEFAGVDGVFWYYGLGPLNRCTVPVICFELVLFDKLKI